MTNTQIALQNKPDYQGYIIVYQGTAKRSAVADKMAKRSLDYLVKREALIRAG